MIEAAASVDARAKRLSLDLMGETVERDLAAAIDDAATGRETMASLLGHQFASCHFLAQRFFSLANAYLDRAERGPAGGEGDKAALVAIRLAGIAARLNERCRAGRLALDKLLPPAPPKVVAFRLDTGIDRVGPPGYDRHWEKPGYRDDDDDKGGGAAPPAGRTGPGSAPPPASRAAGRDHPLAGHGVDRPFSPSAKNPRPCAAEEACAQSAHGVGATVPAGARTEPSRRRATLAQGASTLAIAALLGEEVFLAGHGVDRPFSHLAPGPALDMGPLPALLRDTRHSMPTA